MTSNTNTRTNNNTTHSDIEKKEEYDMTCMTSHQEEEGVEETSTSIPNAVPVIEKYDDTPIPVFPNGYHNSKLEKLVNEFIPNEGEELELPNKEQLLCMAYMENLSFSRNDFKVIYEGNGNNGYYKPNSLGELMIPVTAKMKEFVGKYNFKYRGSHKPYQDMIRSFLESNYNHFKIKVPSNF